MILSETVHNIVAARFNDDGFLSISVTSLDTSSVKITAISPEAQRSLVYLILEYNELWHLADKAKEHFDGMVMSEQENES